MRHGHPQIDSSRQTIGEFLRKPYSYKVPVYQRDFAWTDEEVNTLWEDITGAMVEGQADYFLGAVVISKDYDDARKRSVIDGQQRLIVISMILAAISEAWKARGQNERGTDIFRDFLAAKERRTDELVPKLTLNELNDLVYQQLVLEGRKITQAHVRASHKSNRLLHKAFASIRTKLKSWREDNADDEDALFDLEEFITDRVNLIVIEAGDDSNAFVIFETLNDRGLDLAVSDLVKNYLFSLAGDRIQDFKTAWTEIVLLVGGNNVTQFLRHFWLTHYDLVRERDLYRVLKSSLKTRARARQLLSRLRASADHYAALMSPDHVYWTNFKQEVRTNLEALLLFKVTQFRPVALAAMAKLDQHRIEQVMHILTVISFRYTVIAALGTGNLERIYTTAALDITAGKAKTAVAIFKRLRPAYVDDSRFVEAFKQKRFTKANLARHVLAAINDRLEGDPEKQVAESAGRVTLEHILPKNAGSSWAGALPHGADPSDYVELIGNLTLLERGRNRGIAKASFAEKKKVYAKSTLQLNDELLKHPKWSHETIEKRSRELAKVAKQIWRLDYS